MPFYEYRCEVGHEFEVVKNISEIDREETCQECGKVAERQMPRRFGFTGASDWNTQTWNHGLGCFTKSNREAEKIAKARGLEPVGTEKVENLHKQADKAREDNYKARWSDDRVKLYD
jgi:putative FmdB family regulatory protein